jgi:hypothetical protein
MSLRLASSDRMSKGGLAPTECLYANTIDRIPSWAEWDRGGARAAMIFRLQDSQQSATFKAGCTGADGTGKPRRRLEGRN